MELREFFTRDVFSELLGKTLESINASNDKDKIIFTCEDDSKFIMYHSQDCCETVSIDDICGDLSDLIGSPILLADEVSNHNETPEGIENNGIRYYGNDSYTWTFYKLSTIKGSVTIRWYGESNSYYSKSVDFEKLTIV